MGGTVGYIRVLAGSLLKKGCRQVFKAAAGSCRAAHRLFLMEPKRPSVW